MDSLPHWESLSQAAQACLLRGIQAMLAADARSMPAGGDEASWRELIAAQVVQGVPGSDALGLTGPGICLVLDAMEASLIAPMLLAA
ncbi:MAG: hypothetical protein H0X24_12990 [Ktedonobacterales bacterium]|nr:hypothetical protein [Ktedonobacterales bacterium]